MPRLLEDLRVFFGWMDVWYLFWRSIQCINRCQLQDVASESGDGEVIWVAFFFQTSVALLGVAAQLGKHLQGTMLFMKLGVAIKDVRCLMGTLGTSA